MSSPTYQQLLDQATQQIYSQSESPRIDAEFLLQHVIGKPLAWLIAHGDSAASAAHIKHYAELTAARQAGQPVAYLLGEKEFWSLTLTVNEHVLIPRADTETLVQQALDYLAELPAPRILDLGTGSGAIALALAKEKPGGTVIAVDSQAAALEVARLNAAKNAIQNVEFSLSDWFAAVANQEFDLIVANPPYVAEQDPHLALGDLRFEPASALISAAEGFADLENIIRSAPDYLRMGGALIVEHGFEQAPQVAAMFAAAGFLNITLSKDLNELPRCTTGRYHGQR